ncbi:ADK [Symbiodinium microadriaticum]|nr:ADK [Symbiodinium microadriaticum]
MSGSAEQGAILGIGNPLLDISAEVPMEILEKYGVTLNNAILAEEKHFALYPELVANFPVQYIAGGATQNSIRVAQWMLPTGGCTAYMGAVGTDQFGETLEKCGTDDGVLVHYMKNPDVPTGTCAVLIHGGERSLVANLAAANTFSPAHLETDAAKSMINRAKIVYSAGFFLTVSVESLLSIARAAAEESKIFCMNLAAPFIVQFFGEQLAACMPYTDFVFANESEAAAYGEAKGFGSDVATVALKLAAQPKASGTRPRVVVFTQGADSTIVAVGGNVTRYPVDPLPKEQLVDTNGAGDAFVGGFLSRLAMGADYAECVRAGHFASRVIIQRSGCTFPATCEFA